MLGLMGFAFQDGQMYDVMSMGVTIYTCVFFVVTIKIAMEMSGFTILSALTFLYSICFWFVFVFAHGSIYYLIDIRKCREFPCHEFYGFLQEWRIMTTPRFWLIVAVTVTMAMLRDFFYKCYLRISSRVLYYDVMVRLTFIYLPCCSVNRIEDLESILWRDSLIAISFQKKSNKRRDEFTRLRKCLRDSRLILTVVMLSHNQIIKLNCYTINWQKRISNKFQSYDCQLCTLIN
jgi:magnesium-transporting ATPase (P-type)